VPQNRAKRSSIQLRMIGDDDLREWRITPQYHVTAVLPLNLKTNFEESRYTGAPRDSRQLRHTAKRTASNRYGGTGKLSSWRARI